METGCRGEFFGSSVRFWTEKIKWALLFFYFFFTVWSRSYIDGVDLGGGTKLSGASEVSYTPGV